MRFKPGDKLILEVVQALPGRPITGERLVRPDGTISLGFYGDLKVVGLMRSEVKVRAIEHLRQHLTDEVLGLVARHDDGTVARIAPERSTSVFVEEILPSDSAPGRSERLEALESKLDRILEELEAIRKERAR